MSEQPIDVVLLHAPEDGQAASELRDQLRDHGVQPLLHSTELQASEDGQSQLEEALNASRVCAVLLGSSEQLPDSARKAVERRAARAPDLQVIVVLMSEAQRPTPGDTYQTAGPTPDRAGSAAQAAGNDHETKSGRNEELR